jgi:uncharacterized protein
MWNWALMAGTGGEALPLTSIVGMGSAYHSIDLARFALRSGEGRRLNIETDPGQLELGGQRYAVAGETVPVRIDLSRTATGYVVRMRFTAHVSGPCMRCLGDADVPVEVDAREVDQPPSGDEELRSPYVEGDELELSDWAHDALALALPIQLFCRPDCAGLCPVCGVSLNDADPEEHRHASASDPRWEKLRELRLE